MEAASAGAAPPAPIPHAGGDDASEADLRQLEAAILAGDVEAAKMLARGLAERRVVINAEVEQEAVAASLRRQLQARLIGMGYAPARVIQALRRGGAQSVDEAVAWMSANSEQQPAPN
mmetsp:Transcript_46943/g.102074  ORF Transcript_46943/g.102074 Transcript_46943/m.102074 type:complete len:118 (+) Transcript_46943:31-384(+)